MLALLKLEVGQETDIVGPIGNDPLVAGDPRYPLYQWLLDNKAYTVTGLHKLVVKIDATGLLSCTLGGISNSIPIDRIVVVPFTDLPNDLPPEIAARIPDAVAKILGGSPSATSRLANFEQLAQMRSALRDESMTWEQPLARLEYLYNRDTRVLTLRAGVLHSVSAFMVYHYAATDKGPNRGERRGRLEAYLQSKIHNKPLERQDLLHEVPRWIGEFYAASGFPHATVNGIQYEENKADLYGLVRLDITEGAYNDFSLQLGVKTDVPSGRLTGTAALKYDDFLRSGLALSASGSTGGQETGSLLLDAPVGLLYRREWQLVGEDTHLPQVKVATGNYTEHRTFLAWSQPLTRAAPTGFRARFGEYDLSPEGGGAALRSTVGVIGYSWRQDTHGYWTEPPNPADLLGKSAVGPVWSSHWPLQLDLDVGSNFFGETSYFLHAAAEVRTHVALAPRWLAAMRLGAAWSSRATPILEQPSIGGDAPPGLLRAYNPDFYRGHQAASSTLELRYFASKSIALALGGDFGAADGGAAPSHGVKADVAVGAYFLKLPNVGSLALFWAQGDRSNRWSIGLTSGF